MTTRRCCDCQQDLPLTAFRIGRKSPLRYCRACGSARTKRWVDAHPGYKRAYNRAWHAAHRDYKREYSRAWRAAHPGAGAAASKRYRLKRAMAGVGL